MKNLLLAKSNLRKNKGLSICIAILIIIGSMFLCISCLLNFDYKDSSYREAERLNTSYTTILSYGNSESINSEYIDSIIPESVQEYLYTENLFTQTPIKYNNGEVIPMILIMKKESLNRKLSQIEIVEEDSSINNNYVYLPYQAHTGGNINIGDSYPIQFSTKIYDFKVKGFINEIHGGSTNMNRFDIIVSDEDYNEMQELSPSSKAFALYINFQDDINISKEANRLVNRIFIDHGIELVAYDLDLTIETRTFVSMIFFVSFLMVALIIIGIVMLMIYNNISNYIKENMKNLGALKAIGYTTKDLKKSLLLQFGLLTSIGLILGIISAYLFMPIIIKMLVAQSGIPYSLKFNILSTIITIIFITLFIVIIVMISTRKLKKIEPILALRDGIENHNFKKNHAALDKTKLSLNMGLSLKNIFKNKKQNIISFITVLVLCFLMTIAITMYQNFSREPKLSILTFEIADGVLNVDKSIKDDVINDLANDPEIDDYKYLSNYIIHDEEYIPLVAYILEDTDKINNKENCYEGRYPKYDNEVAISGKYAVDFNYNIGDEVKYHVGNNEYNYIITGYIQSTNNNGRETIITKSGANRLFDVDNNAMYSYWFDSNAKASKIIEKYTEKYGDNITSTIDFNSIIESQMGTFIGVANLMAIVISIVSASIILLVLYLLMKSMIFDRRYEYGILKALGYRSRDLIKQNVLSFIPIIVVAVIIGMTISYYVTNPYIGYMMRSFGIMKSTMVIPQDLVIMSSIFLILTSLLSIIIMSLKIKKIQAYSLLIGE